MISCVEYPHENSMVFEISSNPGVEDAKLVLWGLTPLTFKVLGNGSPNFVVD